MFKKIANCTNIFYSLTKKASLKTNMAVRIMYSLIPALNPLEAKQIAKERIFDLIPGARELLKYGIEIVEEELEHYNNFEIRSLIREKFKIKQNEEALNMSIKAFEDWPNNWPSQFYGGKSWSKITQILLQINNILEKYDYFKEHFFLDKDELYIEISELPVYLNLLDGLMHNTGSFFDKIIEKEWEHLPESVKIKIRREDLHYGPVSESLNPLNYFKKQIYELMDSKELDNPIEVLHFVEPIVRKNAPGGNIFYGDLINEFKSKQIVKKEPIYVNEKNVALNIEKIRVKKEILQTFNANVVTPVISIKEFINKNTVNLPIDALEKIMFKNASYLTSRLLDALDGFDFLRQHVENKRNINILKAKGSNTQEPNPKYDVIANELDKLIIVIKTAELSLNKTSIVFHKIFTRLPEESNKLLQQFIVDFNNSFLLTNNVESAIQYL